MKKRILFLSGIDFKEKSIQVIKKTPEAYVAAGWDVVYIVARDSSKSGNYFYERELPLPGATLLRTYWPLAFLRDRAPGSMLKLVLAKIDGWLVVLQLLKNALKVLRSRNFDVIYGYEVHGVLAVALLRIFLNKKERKPKIVTRFQGTWLYGYLSEKRLNKIIFNLDHILALRSSADLCIMTNDGTRGAETLGLLNAPAVKCLKFWPNGVDIPKVEPEFRLAIREKFCPQGGFLLVSVSRLESWKRVDRCIRLVAELKKTHSNFRYLVIGEGVLKRELEELADKLDLRDNVIFLGAIPGREVFKYMSASDFFLSMYDLSNVGNPLLEAIRCHQIIVTLNNGDTGSWIEHMVNGLIYAADESLYSSAARDIAKVIDSPELKNKILAGVVKTESDRLWTWQERLAEEISCVEGLLK